jgi:hypothetical protein
VNGAGRGDGVMKGSWRSMSDLKGSKTAGSLVSKATTTNQGSGGGGSCACGATPRCGPGSFFKTTPQFDLLHNILTLLLYAHYCFHEFTGWRGSFLTAGLVVISWPKRNTSSGNPLTMNLNIMTIMNRRFRKQWRVHGTSQALESFATTISNMTLKGDFIQTRA